MNSGYADQKEKPTGPPVTKKCFLSRAQFMTAFALMGINLPDVENELKGLNLEEEYQKIQGRESTLPANKRRLVVAHYERESK